MSSESFNYTSVDPKQFKQIQSETCNLVKYMLDGLDDFFLPFIFSFASHMKGAKGSQDHFRAQEGGHTNQHQGGQV